MPSIDNGWEGFSKERLIEMVGGNKKESIEDLESRITNLYSSSFGKFLNKNDVVADFGSGFGFGAKHLSNQVKQIHCFDVSNTLHAECLKNISTVNNMDAHLIFRNDVSNMQNKDINKIISNAVFCHFNIIEMAFYLQKFYDILPEQGEVIFSFRDADLIDLEDSLFKEHQEILMKNREFSTRCISYVSTKNILDVCSKIGYKWKIMSDRNEKYKTIKAVKE